MTPYRKKLIEVALPLEAINVASAREKSIRHGHPSTLHLWWARRPLAACRAVLFASLVDDPSSRPEQFPTEKDQDRERQRLFRLIEELVKWENTHNPTVLDAAKKEILKSTDGNPPPVLDPFCGGGSIPLEAQRLGLKAYASDLNPVAVLITKAMIEIPPRFAGRPPVNPEYRKQHAGARQMQDEGWTGAKGLAEDVRYYGRWMRDEADRRIGHLYPKVTLPKEQGGVGGTQATVIAWLWARTVKCPNPACGATMPLVRSFTLSTKTGKKTWVEPIIDKAGKAVRFEVRTGNGAPPDGTVNRRGAHCIVCGQAVPFDHVRAEGMAGRMGAQLMAIVAKGRGRRICLSPVGDHAAVAEQAEPTWRPDCILPKKHRNFQTPAYGMPNLGDLFTRRQLVALTTLSDLVSVARERVRVDARVAGLSDDGAPLESGGRGAQAYADAVATYLGMAVSKLADYNSTLVVWSPGRDQVKSTFARQALPMVWDFGEVNPFAEAAGDLTVTVSGMTKALESSPPVYAAGEASQLDSTSGQFDSMRCISTDPPYYDNIGYADLSDFFYVWIRRSLNRVFPTLFSTLLVPKAQELIATPYRFGGDKAKAQHFFEAGLGKAFQAMRDQAHPDYPLTVYYAFKQSETDEEDDGDERGAAVVASTGWETMLDALLAAGFQVGGTWPMRTERTGRTVEIGNNALASSIVLVCRPRAESAPMATRRELMAELHRELPAALRELQQGNIAPVDLAQATIGPGMAVFSRYARVLEADGSAMRVRTALQLINQELDAYLAEQEGDFDGDTRFCIAWFEQRGMDDGPFGEADVLARAKNTSVEGLVRAGVLQARAGKVRLLRREEYPDDWNPLEDHRLTVWECAQYLIRALERGGEAEAAKLAARLGGGRSEEARALAYRLYAICERKGRAQEALAYNMLVAAWRDVQAQAANVPDSMVQGELEL